LCQVRTTSSAKAVPGRRVPSQERSKKRVEAILDAAAHIFAEAGFEAATMEEIAARAETSIGSIYQFFPHKLAVFESLARRYLDRSQVLFDHLLSPEVLKRPWTEVLDLVIDGFAAMQSSEPGFRAIWMNFQLYGVYADADRALHRQFIERAQSIIATHAPRLARGQRVVISSMLVQVLSGVMFLSAQEGASFFEQMISETKLLLRRYLGPYLEKGKGRSSRSA